LNFIKRNRVEFAVSFIFIFIMLVFIIIKPDVFLNSRIYFAIFTTLPIMIIMTVSIVFVIASGEIDLAFPSLIGISALAFASSVKIGLNPFAALIISIIVGSFWGLINGLLVSSLEISSLILTLGMNFLIRGLILIITNGLGIPLAFLRDTKFYQVFVGKIGNFPVQMLWSIIFVSALWMLFYRHKFGGHLCYIGDNIIGSREMGINVRKTKTLAYTLVGACSGFCGVLVCLINNQFWPTSGEGYLLVILAAVFIGGTPVWGGVGTIFGAVVGALIIVFIESGIIAVGLTGFYTKFFSGLILILALISHKISGLKKKF